MGEAVREEDWPCFPHVLSIRCILIFTAKLSTSLQSPRASVIPNSAREGVDLPGRAWPAGQAGGLGVATVPAVRAGRSNAAFPEVAGCSLDLSILRLVCWRWRRCLLLPCLSFISDVSRPHHGVGSSASPGKSAWDPNSA